VGDGSSLRQEITATVRVSDGTIRQAEVHWFEAYGKGKREMRVKRFLD
jgi:hypothetical protein